MAFGTHIRTYFEGQWHEGDVPVMRAAGIEIRECVLSFADVAAADEVFLSGNFSKVTSVSRFDDTTYRSRAMTDSIRSLYLDWAHSAPARML